MTTRIRLLICEDSEDDAVLIAGHLRRGGLAVDYERVERAAQTAEALAQRPPDLVISDYMIPGFGAEDALRVLRESGLDVPFILVTGRIGEETAATLMRAGAHDFVLKDRMTRLVPVINRELRQARARREHRDAEAALQMSEQRFRLFAEHSPDVMFRYRIHPIEEVEYFSPASDAVLGHPPQELCGDPETVFSLVSPEDRPDLEASWHAPGPEPLVVCWLRPDGTEAWTEQRAVGLYDESGRIVAVEGILRDVTDRVRADIQRERLRQQLRQAERLESLGRLAGGIAHDFNNLLAVILGHTDLALTELPKDSPHRAGMELIRRLSERGAALTRQLLVFSRQEPLHPETLDANEVVADTERVLRGAIGEDVEFIVKLSPDLWPVRIDRSELERLLLNLVVNSRRAMPYGGRLIVATSNVPPPTTTAAGTAAGTESGESAGSPGSTWSFGSTDPAGPIGAQLPGDPGGSKPDPGDPGSGRPEGSLVRLCVTDTGIGMSPEVAKHAFEPFFTTDATAGTGLGLSAAYGVVKAAGGEISLTSRPGGGTTVRIDLPAVGRQAPRTPANEPSPPSGDGQTLLVVEDDESVRTMVALMVRRSGYRAIEAPSPAAAMVIVDETGQTIDLLLTDLVMAGMSGVELADAARARRPELPVVLMSGYTAGTLPGDAVLPDGTLLIRKPFTTAALLRVLNEALEQRR